MLFNNNQSYFYYFQIYWNNTNSRNQRKNEEIDFLNFFIFFYVKEIIKIIKLDLCYFMMYNLQMKSWPNVEENSIGCFGRVNSYFSTKMTCLAKVKNKIKIKIKLKKIRKCYFWLFYDWILQFWEILINETIIYWKHKVKKN